MHNLHNSNPADWKIAGRQDPTTTVVLHGALAKRFGRRHELGVTSAAEAAHALCSLHPGFREHFQDGHYRVIRGTVKDGLPLSEGMLNLKIGRAGEIHFLPRAAGAKNGGTGKAILGAVIIIAAIVAAPFTAGGSIAGAMAATSALGVSFGTIAMFGASMLLAGISQLMSPQPKNNSNTTDPKASFGLSGQMNSVTEGSPVPVVYGRQRVGSVVASFGFSAEDYSPPTNPDGSDIILTSIEGGSGAVGSGGGGKGGGSSGASEAPNTLRSKAVIRVVDLLSEGPIGGLVDGAKSIFFNGTPLMAADGSYNFQGVTWEVRLGYPDQAVVPGYPAVEQTLAPELGLPFQVLQLAPKTVTVNSPTATAARVTVRLPELVKQNTTNGNLEAGPDLDYLFDVRQPGGNWIRVATEHLSGQKCTSPYQRSYRFGLPGATDATRPSTWDIRMTRVTVDDADSATHSETFFDEVTLITEHQIMYANTAAIFLTVDASGFNGNVPTREYEIDGLLCQVPLNYDPVGHTYATTGPGTSMGTWDGASWKPAVTSNPAWCLYDMFQSARYGMGLPPSALAATRYDLFPISQYCDGLVPAGYKDADGNDLTELRYELNVVMSTQDDAYRVLQSLVSAFRGMCYWGAGRVVVTADMPCMPSSLMNPGNVIDGTFEYEGTSLKTRHTVARVAWQDPASSYKTSIEVVEDFARVVTFGQVTTDIHAFGCTSRGLAHRLGKWLLDTEQTQNETVNCKTSMEHLRVRPGDVVLLTDPAFVGQVMGGRCGPGSELAKIYLDRIIPWSPQLYYTLALTLPDGTVEIRGVNSITVYPGGNSGNSIVSMGQAFSQPPDVHASWVLSSIGNPGHATGEAPTGSADSGGDATLPVVARQFRILGLTETQRGTFAVIGINHDPNKYARIEYGIQFDPTPYSVLGQLLATPMPPPTNVTARDYMAGVGTTTLVRVTVSCTPANDPRVVGQQYRAAGPDQRIESDITANHDFDNLALGDYVFSVRSVGRDGRSSAWVDSTDVLVDGMADPPPAVTGLTAQGTAMAVDLSVHPSTARDFLHWELWRAPGISNGQHPYPFDTYFPTGSPGQNGATLLATFGGTTYHDSGDVLGPDKAWAYWIRAVNTTLVQGPFAGPVKALTTFYLTDNLEEGIRNTASYAQALLGGAPTLVTDLSQPGTKEGQLVFNTTDQQLYSWDATHQQWVRFIPLIPDSTGKLTAAQIGAINQVQIQGTLTQDQTNALLAGLAASSITSSQIASLIGDKVTGTISNAQMSAGQIFDVDPVTGNVVRGVSTAKLLGTLAATKIVDVDSLGNIIPGISSNRISGTIPTSQLVGNLLAAAGVVLNLAGGNIQGVLAAANSAALDALSGQISSVQISNDAITAPKIKAGELAARMIGADLVQAANIASGAVTTAKLSVGSINNSIANSCFAFGMDGWGIGAGASAIPVIGTADQALYSLDGLGAVRVNAGVLGAAGSGTDTRDVWLAQGGTGTGRFYDCAIPCTPGETWEAQATFIPFGGCLQVFVLGCDANGAGTISPRTAATTFVPPADGRTLDKWQTIGVRVTIPPGTVRLSLLLRFSNPSAGPANIGSFVTRTLLGKTVPNATDLLPWTPGGVTQVTGGLIATNTIVARNLVADTITTRELAAGAVTAENLAIGSPANVIWNPSCVLATDGWIFGGSIPVASGFGNPSFSLAGEGTGFVTAAGNLAINQNIYAFWQPSATAVGVSVEPGTWVEAQARVGAHRCSTFISIQFFDSNGIYMPGAELNGPSQRGGAGGTALAAYMLCWTKGVVPAGAAMARMVIYGVNDGAAGMAYMGALPTGQNPYVFFSRAQLGSSSPVPMALSQPQTWVPGGITSVSGGVIQTNTILARSIAANQITARELAVGNSSNVITNSCLAISSEGWQPNYSAGSSCTILSCASSRTAYATADGAGIIEGFYAASGAINDAVTKPFACAPGDTLEAQAMIRPLGVNGWIFIAFYDANGTLFAQSPASAVVGGQADAPAGVVGTLAAFFPVQVIAAAPAGTASVRLYVRSQSGGAGYTALIFTRTLLGKTVPGATQASPWAPGGITSIGGGMIATESIVARNIAAGSISADKLNVASPSNVVSNSCCSVSAFGWQNFMPGAIVGSVTGDFVAPASYALSGLGTGVTTTGATIPANNAGGLVIVWDPDLMGGIPINPGECWEASAFLGAHRCWARVRLQFMTTAGAVTAELYGGRVAGILGGTEINQYGFSWTKGIAPPGTTRARLVIDGLNDGGADIATTGTPGVNPFVFFTKVVLGPSVPNASTPQPWSPGGATQIYGGEIKTGGITARVIGAGAITAEKLSVGSASNVITNPCCAVGTFGWSYGVSAWQQSDLFCLTGYGTGYAALGAQAAGATADYSWAPLGDTYNPDGRGVVPWGAAVPCATGELWEAQALVQTHRCSVELFVMFLGQNADGSWSLISAPSTGAQAFPQPGFGKAESNYSQIVVKGVVPVNATLVTLMMRMGNTPVAQAVHGAAAGNTPFLMFTKTALGLGLPNVPKMPWGPGGRVSIEGGEIRAGSIFTNQLAAGSVTAATIAAGAITTGALAAGAVTADKLTIGSPSNFIWNASCDQGPFGWGRFTFGVGQPAFGSNPIIVMDAASTVNGNWALTGWGSGFMQRLDSAPLFTNHGFAWDWSPQAGHPGLPAASNATYGGAALLQPNSGGIGFIQLLFLDYNQNVLSITSSASIPSLPFGNGLIEDFYQRAEVIAVSPPNTAFVILRIILTGSPAGAVSPFMAFSKAQLGQLPAGGKLGPWVPGGITTIDGNTIATGTLNASRITAGTIVAGNIAAGSITGDRVAVNTLAAYNLQAYTITGDRIAANTIVGGNVQAAAIAGTQIAGYAIHAIHLASEQLLTSSAQIGVATIEAANIKDLTVENAKIANLTLGTGKLGQGCVTDVAVSQSLGNSSTPKSINVFVGTDSYTSGVVITMRAYFAATYGTPQSPNTNESNGSN